MIYALVPTGTHIIDRAIMACSKGKQTSENNYISSAKRPKYIGKLQASMSEEVQMAEAAPPAAVPETSVAAVEEPVAETAAPAAPAVEMKEVAAPSAEEVASAPADANSLLAMNREQLAQFTAKVTSEASNKVEEMTRAMEAQQSELEQLRIEHQKRVDEQKAKEQQAFAAKLSELQREGFNESGLLSGIEKMAQTDMNGTQPRVAFRFYTLILLVRCHVYAVFDCCRLKGKGGALHCYACAIFAALHWLCRSSSASTWRACSRSGRRMSAHISSKLPPVIRDCCLAT